MLINFVFKQKIVVLQDYKNAGSLTKDAMFKNIVVN